MVIEFRRSWLLAILLGASGACASNADIPMLDPGDAGGRRAGDPREGDPDPSDATIPVRENFRSFEFIASRKVSPAHD